MLMLCQTISGFNLVGIMAVRYLAISRPLSYKMLLSRKRMKIAIAVLWLVGTVICLAVHVRPEPGKRVSLHLLAESVFIFSHLSTESFCGVCVTDDFWDDMVLSSHFCIAVAFPFVCISILFVLMSISYGKHVRGSPSVLSSNITTATFWLP